jgi:hypothetical protein
MAEGQLCNYPGIKDPQTTKAADRLIALVKEGQIDPHKSQDFPEQMSIFAQSLLDDPDQFRKSNQLKAALNCGLPSDFPTYTDVGGHLRVANLSQTESYVNDALQTLTAGSVSLNLEMLNESLKRGQREAAQNLEPGAPQAIIQRDVAEAFVSDFNRRTEESKNPFLHNFVARLGKDGLGEIVKTQNT